MLSLQTGGNAEDAAIEQSLRTSISLNARFAPSYDALAHLFSARRERLEEAHTLTLRAVELEPDNIVFRQNAAEILAQQGQFDAAIGVLRAALRLAKTPGETEMLRSRISQLEQYKAHARRFVPPASR